MTAGVIGAMVKQQGLSISQNYSGFNAAVWPSDPTQQVYGMKNYFSGNGTAGMSNGNGTVGAFPTTLGADGAYAASSNFKAVVACYKPWMNLTLGAWDSTQGSAGSGGSSSATHGGTKADWQALSASVSALNGLLAAQGVTLYVVLWQEIEHMHAPSSGGGMNLTNYQYWSMLSWYGNAVYGSTASGGAGLPMSRLLHNSSASYSGQLDAFFPGGQTGSGAPSAPLVGGGTTDFYSRSWVNYGYRLDSVPANANYSTSIIGHCANAGIPFMGCLEFGIGGNNVPSNSDVLSYLDHINTVAATYSSAMYFWYGESQDSSYGLIPGYASGQSFTETNPNPPPAALTFGPGPDCTPKLRTLAATLAAVPLAVTTTSLPGGTARAFYTATLAATGGTSPYTWSLYSGSLPHGLTLQPSTGAITGTPTATGSSTFTVSVTDTTGTTALSGPLTITISAAVFVVTTTSLPPGVAGLPYGAALSAANGTLPYSWSLASGGLPPGLSLSTGGVIFGIPSGAGASALTVEATDSATPTPHTATSGPLTITVYAALLEITTVFLPPGTAGIEYAATLSATGGEAPYTWSATGLPSGFALDPDAGALTCAAPEPTTTAVIFQVTDSVGTIATESLVVEIAVTRSGTAELAVQSGGVWVGGTPETLSGGTWVAGSLYSAASGSWQ